MIPPAALADLEANVTDWLPHRHLEPVTAALVNALTGWNVTAAPDVEPLHHRQDQLLLGWARGWTDQQIANELGLSLSTVLTYGKRLRHRLGATNRAHAVARAYETGLLRHGDVTTTTEPR
ncbi:response regulator transcription factor [Embleya sp. NPDC001921]